MPGFSPVGAAPIGGDAGDAVVAQNLSDGMTLSDTLPPIDLVSNPDMADGTVSGETTAVYLAHLLSETLITGDSALSIISFRPDVQDALQYEEAIQLVWNVAAADGVDLSDVLTNNRKAIVDIIDQVAGTDTVEGKAIAKVVAAAAIALSDLATLGFNADVSDTVVMADALSHLYKANLDLIDTAIVADALQHKFVVVGVAAEGVNFGDSLSDNIKALEDLDDGYTFQVAFELDGDPYVAWVLNAESAAASKYTNYPFNSFAEVEGKYYGATDTGIYLLEGDTDAGTKIDAALRTGLLDFGTSLHKRISAAYIGYASDGQMALKVVSTQDGKKVERHFVLRTQPSDAPSNGRVKVGRGVKSRYWQFELVNVDGADFDVESMQFLPLILSRRI